MRDYRDHPDERRDEGREPRRYEYDDKPGVNYDSHYDEGEDPVGFVNIIDMDIPFFQLVWLMFKILLATIVAAGFLYLLGMLLHMVLSLPMVQDILPDGATWLRNLMGGGLNP